MPIDQGAGEVIDAKSFGNSVVVSMQGDWDGRTMAGIIKDARAKDDNGVRSHEIGAGGLVVAGDALYATGYRISEHPIPVIRKIANVGRVEWERSFNDLVDYTFSDGHYFDGHIFLVAEPLYEDRSKPRRIVVLKLDLSGNEVARGTITALFSNLLIGKKYLLSRSASGLALLVNSQELSAMDQTRRERFGLPTWCLGRLSTSMHVIDLASMSITSMGTVADFQTFSAEAVEGRLLLGGLKRSACSDSGAAAIYEVTSSETPRLFWIDNDLFPSNVQSVRRFNEGVAVVVKRERPVGVRSVTQSTDGASKRWGDDGSELWEFSILEIDRNGGIGAQYDSAFGLSSFVQGIVVANGDLVAFGSLGGRPALSSDR
jgi:hypothetical protein